MRDITEKYGIRRDILESKREKIGRERKIWVKKLRIDIWGDT